MALPVLTAITLIFIVWINYEIYKNSKYSKESTEDFWNREKESNQGRRSDISSLQYITVTTQGLPMAEHLDVTINNYRDLIQSLSGKKAINLSNYTNTELKSKYGPANLDALTNYDNNYILLVSTLHRWASRLYEQGNVEHAAIVLEYAISCNTDITNSYRLLAKIYKQLDRPDKIDSLINLLPSSVVKDKLTEELRSIINS